MCLGTSNTKHENADRTTHNTLHTVLGTLRLGQWGRGAALHQGGARRGDTVPEPGGPRVWGRLSRARSEDCAGPVFGNGDSLVTASCCRLAALTSPRLGQHELVLQVAMLRGHTGFQHILGTWWRLRTNKLNYWLWCCCKLFVNTSSNKRFNIHDISGNGKKTFRDIEIERQQ